MKPPLQTSPERVKTQRVAGEPVPRARASLAMLWPGGHPGSMQACDVIRLLDLARHPEGGWYREIWRAPLPQEAADGQRCAGTAIYYLLEAGDFSHWHCVDATELWHWYAGAPLSLSMSPDGHNAAEVLLGPGLDAGQRPQRIVPAGCWQAAVSLGAWTLAGCTVSPGFEFAGFEMAPPGWRPTRGPQGAGA